MPQFMSRYLSHCSAHRASGSTQGAPPRRARRSRKEQYSHCLDMLRGGAMSRRNEYDLICIGSGPAGQRAAIQAAKLGKKAAVIEKQQCVGGVCIETGTIPSKTFREAVRRLYAQPHLDDTDADTYVPRLRPTMPHLISHV